jgi:hypothetical protein
MPINMYSVILTFFLINYELLKKGSSNPINLCGPGNDLSIMYITNGLIKWLFNVINILVCFQKMYGGTGKNKPTGIYK